MELNIPIRVRRREWQDVTLEDGSQIRECKMILSVQIPDFEGELPALEGLMELMLRGLGPLLPGISSKGQGDRNPGDMVE